MCKKATPTALAHLGLGRPAWVDYTSFDPWPVPHHRDADFTATGEGSEVLDELARVSKVALCAAGETNSSVMGHADWEARNLRFDNDRLEMIYDWDSLVVERESVIVGLASAVFPARSEPGLGDAPSAAEQDAFLTDYQQTAGRVFTPVERTLAVAAASWITAYNARIQFSTARRRGGRAPRQCTNDARRTPPHHDTTLSIANERWDPDRLVLLGICESARRRACRINEDG